MYILGENEICILLIKLEYLEGGGGGGGLAHYPNTPQYTGVLLCNWNLYKYF